MNRAIACAALLLSGIHAPTTVWAAAERARPESTESTTTFILWSLVVVVAALVGGGLWYLHLWRHASAAHSHPRLMKDLCRLHGLGRSDRWLLGQVAQVHQLRYPALVFLDSKWLDVQHLTPALQAKQADLAAIRARIFAEEPAAG